MDRDAVIYLCLGFYGAAALGVFAWLFGFIRLLFKEKIN